MMKNTIRCCISCILPCGALDVIRIVHSNGRVEEISGTIRASEIMKAHPKHVLKKPSSSPSDDGVVPKIVIVPPDAELQRGKIYFLIPVPSSATDQKSRSRSSTKKKRKEQQQSQSNINNMNNSISMTTNLLISDRYLSEILSEKVSTQRDRRRGRVGVWRPHLESISESPSDI
ncbi:6,7-dimethyl-8-ribityllumazine synthase [Melia azedarach]|uniref:6,7-dimethyl-8-ribityllumazine synthase n=1 Tax=Melia azedarach TaxID=155640 RepID=A0ACC1WX45_MELAZ|nr:6,7-dimethyl-8-ribityllumazine synthase [Melia azedarach]